MTNHSAVVVILSILIPAVSVVMGNDYSKRRELRVSSAPRAEIQAAPFKNYWHSGSWEANSGELFWHSTTAGSSAKRHPASNRAKSRQSAAQENRQKDGN